MQITIYFLLFFFFLPGDQDSPSLDYDDYFLDQSLRVDLYQVGTAKEERIAIHQLKQGGSYAGPRDCLIDPRDLGSHRIDLFEPESGARIFSRGFCTLYAEWQTIQEALDGVLRVFEHTLVMPMPKKEVILSISRRKPGEGLQEIFRQSLVLDGRFLRRDNPHADLRVVKLVHSGEPEKKVDVVILGDGYSSKEMDSYIKDARKAADQILSVSPIKENKRKFNFWAVESPSLESGVDEPRKEAFLATCLDVSFNTFDLPRYAMSAGIHNLNDVAAAAPCDFIVVIFNSSRYGGGGVYHLYAMATGANGGSRGVLAHEFGHSFGGLGDEYYSSDVSYVDYYPDGLEPWEPNLTALLDPKKPKWGNRIKADTPIPTPYESKYGDRVGCFEGAGYRAKGLYRPGYDCIMKSCAGSFCPVCSDALLEAIRFYAR